MIWHAAARTYFQIITLGSNGILNPNPGLDKERFGPVSPITKSAHLIQLTAYFSVVGHVERA